MQVLHLLKLPEAGDKSSKLPNVTPVYISLQAILQTEPVLRANSYEGAGTYTPVTVRSMTTYPDNGTFHSPSRAQYFTKVMPVIHRPNNQNRGFQT